MSNVLRIQPIVIPRAYFGAERLLAFCVVFGLRPLAPEERKKHQGVVPEVFDKWPEWIDHALKSARVVFEDEKPALPLKFERRWPHDLAHGGWTPADSATAWQALFGELIREETKERASALLSLYETGQSKDLRVNPRAASDLNPADRLESLQPKALVAGIAAAHFDRIRNEELAARPELDGKYLAALDPEVVDRTFLALARQVEDRPERYSAEVREGCRRLLGFVGRGGPAPREALSSWPPKHRAAINNELVNLVLEEQQGASQPEFQRAGRWLDSNKSGGTYDAASEQEKLRKPTYAEMIARVRQYPGLARRLGLVVHGVAALPAGRELQSRGRVRLELEKAEPELFTKRPVYTWYYLNGNLFRPKVNDPETFAPGTTTDNEKEKLFYKHHVLDGELYAVTQQDYMISAARAAALVTGTATIEAEVPVRSARAELREETRRNRTNSVQFVSCPRGPKTEPGSTKAPEIGSAEAIHERLIKGKEKYDDNSALTAEDLMAGVSIYVRPRGAGLEYGWRSLCRRVVRVTPKNGRCPLMTFEEEGYIAGATAELPAPITGVLTGLRIGTRGVERVTIQRLLVENKISTENKPYDVSDEERVRFRGSLRSVPSEQDLQLDDVVRLTLGLHKGGKNYLTEIQIVPILKPSSTTLFGDDAIVSCAGATSKRREQKFTVLFSKTTQFLDENGKLFERSQLQEKGQYDPKLIAKNFAQFFVEGENRLLSNGPFFRTAKTDHVLFRVLTGQAQPYVPLANELLVHPSVPPSVLRGYHLDRSVDQCRDVPLPLPATAADAKEGDLTDADLIHVRELTTPLNHIRGTVVDTRFEMTAHFLRPVEGKPKKAFINIRGRAWQIDTPGEGTFPRLFKGQENTDVVNIYAGASQLGLSLVVPNAPGEIVPGLASAADNTDLTAVELKQYVMRAPKGGVVIETLPDVTRDLLNEGKTPDQLQLRLVGEVKTSVSAGKRVVRLVVDGVTPIGTAPAKKGEDTFQFTWVLRVRDGHQPVVEVRYDGPRRNLEYSLDDLEGKFSELIHPADATGYRVGAVTSGGTSGVVTGRAWPQAVPGTTRKKPGTERFEFATIDGLHETEIVSLDGKEATGFFYLRDLDPDPTLTNPLLAKQLEKKNSAPDAPQCQRVWAAKDDEPVQIVGEVIETRPAGTDGSAVPVVSIALTGDRKAAIALDDQRAKEFLPRHSNSAPRNLGELNRGEFVVIRGAVDFGTGEFPPGRIRPGAVEKDDPRVYLAAVVRGYFVPQNVRVEEPLRDGSLKHRVVIRSANGAEVTIHVDPRWIPTNAPLREVVTVASPLLVAATVSRWVDPIKPEAKATDPKTFRDPVHAVSSDLIARWSGWVLTTDMPGTSDEVAAPAQKQDTPFRIACDRSVSGVNLFPGAGDWRMPPLRFGTDYEFCLRRVDLAGNHLYDEGALPADIDPAAIRRIVSLLEGNAALAAIGFPPVYENPHLFERADPPFPAPLVFPADCPNAVWEKEAPAVSTPSGLVKLTHNREPVLVLFSDVLERGSLAASATGTLLPPSAPVETVLMHGVLDYTRGSHIPDVIRCYERYLQDERLGIDRGGYLNYFGDPQVRKLRLQFVLSEKAAPPGQMPEDGTSIDTEPFGTWPCPRPVDLSIIAGTRNREFLGVGDLGKLSEVQRSQTGAKIQMPPGGTGYAAVVPVLETKFHDGGRQKIAEAPHDIGQRIRVIHVTNGAWVRPRWLELYEEPPKPDQTSRRLQGTFQADVATSGTFTLSAYWNECWDEAVSLGWEEAVASIQVEKGKICAVTIPEGRGGYGYGTEAVVAVAVKPGEKSPTTHPVLAPVVADGQVKQVRVLDGGDGFDSDRHELRIIRRPPLFRIAEARVTRKGRGPLRPEEIQITDQGGWYSRAPFVIAIDVGGDGYGAQLTAHLNGRGGVCRIGVEHGGQNWSDDVIIKFYTHQWSLPERPIPADSPIRVKLESPRSENGEPPPPVWQPFGDPAGRNVDYFLTIMARYSEYLLPVTEIAESAPTDRAVLVRTPVPRVSLPFNLNIVATVRPGAPRVARLLPSFRWNITDGSGSPADPTSYFHTLEKGQLTFSRKASVRVYLRRPWHQTGAELLGVVLVPAIANTTRIRGDLNPMDKTVVNRAPDYPNKAGFTNALDGDVIPRQLREIVTRWGFDPIHNEGALPPLDRQHFPAAVPGTDTECLPIGGDTPERRAALALHDVHYDGAKNLWYSDIAINLTDRGTPLDTYPFLRLGLVAYQCHAIEKVRSSSVTVCDPFPVVPDRTLIVRRLGWADFELTLNGVFATDPSDPNQFPRRRVVVEVQQREPDLPQEVELFLSPGETMAQRKPLLAELELKWHSASKSYRGRLTLPSERKMDERESREQRKLREPHEPREPRAAARRVVIAVLEKEYYRTVSPQPSATGDRTEMFNNVPCGVRILSSFTIGLEKTAAHIGHENTPQHNPP